SCFLPPPAPLPLRFPYTTLFRSMGASRWQIFRWVIFPHMIPSFFAGMRLGMSGVLLGVLLAELYVSTAGIGYFTQLFTQNFDPTDRKSTRLNSSHVAISYAVFCL